MLRISLVRNLLAIVVGMGFLVTVELSLHLVGSGPSSRLFLKSCQDGEVVYTVNQRVGHRFFQQQYLRPVPYDPSFPQAKPPDMVRIFVLGASTLLGFPNPPNTAFPRFLEAMLVEAYPERQFNIVNCGMTAINTFCLLDFVAEVVEYKPDAIIVYAGHNEFVGPYGVTSPFTRFGNDRTWIRFYMALQRSRIYYWVNAGVYRLQRWFGPADGVFGLHLIDKEIGLLDEEYLVTANNYRENLAEMLLQARRHGVPVLLSTLVANLKDFYPMRSDCDDRMVSLEVEGLVRQGRLQAAIEICEESLRKHPYCAGIHFDLGRLFYRTGAYSKAYKAFVYARDMDRLPLRAPTIFNQIVRELADAAGDQVVLSDIERTFAGHSPGGIVGNELITEYLHPTAYGHYLMAQTMFQGLAQSPIVEGWGASDTGRLKSYDDYSLQLGHSLWDRISYRNDLMLFLRKLPYREPPAILRRHVAALMREQMRDISLLDTVQGRVFAGRKGIIFLAQMMDFLLPEDRRTIKEGLERLDSVL